MANELVVMGEDTSVSLWRKPEQVLTEAKEAATALIKVVEMKKNKVVFNGETYLEFEDWQCVAKFYGCTTKIISTNPVEFDGVRGFEATAVVIDRHGSEIGRVDSMCLSDEENWGDVPKYEWRDVLDANGKKIWDPTAFKGKGGTKRERVEVSRTPKPLFQLRSMAQTRAQVKALRSVFSWVVVMAGYQPTPAEELTGNEFPPEEEQEQRKPVEMPKATKQEIKPSDAVGVIEARKPGKDNALWIVLKGGQIVAVPADKVGSHPFNVGDRVSFTAIEKVGKEQTFWQLGMIHSYESNVDDPLPPMEDGKAEPKAQEESDKMLEEFDQTEPEPQPTGKVIGKSRERRLYTLMSLNKAKTGLNEDIVHKLLKKMPKPVEHLSDLDIGLHEGFEDFMTGKADWKPLLED